MELVLYADVESETDNVLATICGQHAEEEPIEVIDDDTTSGEKTPAKVILFNDAWHNFEEVIGQIIKAIGCDTGKAEQITMEVHTKGKAVVYEGEMNECLRINAILEEISLNTQIEI